MLKAVLEFDLIGLGDEISTEVDDMRGTPTVCVVASRLMVFLK